jgi:hypothetical protein
MGDGPLPGLPLNTVSGRASPRARLPAQAQPGAAWRASPSPVAYGPGRARVGPKSRASGRAAGPRAAWLSIPAAAHWRPRRLDHIVAGAHFESPTGGMRFTWSTCHRAVIGGLVGPFPNFGLAAGLICTITGPVSSGPFSVILCRHKLFYKVLVQKNYCDNK